MKKITIRAALTLLCILIMCQSVSAAELLVPVGQIIGLAMEDNTVTVVSFDETMGNAAKAAGLQVGDKITQINKQTIRCAEDVRKAQQCSDGTAAVSVLRSGKSKTLHITPQITQDGPRLGVYLKEGVTGVGTVTFYDPETGRFGALGHGVNDANGDLLAMNKGKAYRATVLSIRKGKSGDPGQLMGSLTGAEPIGTLSKNTVQGVFGSVTDGWQGEKLPTASTDQIHTGEAVILSTISGDTVQEYSVEILKIYPNSKACGRNLLLRVTDPDLLTATGGIVQGMSGSPIIQDGKLVGAVTHVLVNDPTTGYGIFIENMLDAAA